MKIKYEFVDGDVELEVSDEWASVLAELDRLERNNDKKEKRRHYSLEACTYEGADYAVEDKKKKISIGGKMTNGKVSSSYSGNEKDALK